MKIWKTLFRALTPHAYLLGARLAKISTWAVALVVVAAGPAQAQTNITKEFQIRAQNLIQKAMNNGWTQIGDQTLASLATGIQTPRVFENNKHLVVQVETRATAMWQVDSHTVFVNRKNWEAETEEAKEGIAFHELCGASGCHDENYQLSVRLKLMGVEKYAPGSPLGTRLTNFAGGVTSVGGGGDGDELLAKINLYRLFSLSVDKTPNLKPQERLHLKSGFLDLRIDFMKYQWAATPPTVGLDQRTNEVVLTVGTLVLASSIESGDFSQKAYQAILQMQASQGR